MISDILLDAYDEIEDGLATYGDRYPLHLQVEIVQMQAALKALALKLAAPLSDAELVERGFVPLIVPEEDEA